jgi:hypothetical protein
MEGANNTKANLKKYTKVEGKWRFLPVVKTEWRFLSRHSHSPLY